MSIKNVDNATELLIGWQNRDKSKSTEFLEYAYQDIRAIVGKYLQQQSPNETILHDASVTELSNECIVKLHRWRNDEQPFESRQEFSDYVRVSVWHLLFGKPHQSFVNKQQLKRDFLQSEITQVIGYQPNWDQNVDLLNTLELLQENHSRQSEVFELKYFAMVSHQQIADMLSLSPRTVDNDLKFALVWLRSKLTE
ncbi:ECF-type sigma factor [Psychromonas hadalis]|uniref:ECF-type sigma factor n=1 Tax=Psychromonas hadalis TaxID=211669 RepID=UPI0003B6A87A|nr:ECF-type sigma factor [Psychromonas hadalis]